MSANPYVAPVDDSLSHNWAEGSTELTDVSNLFTDIATQHDAVSAVFDTGAAALDVLGDIGDPLGAVIGCAVGWIVDHVGFLREPVDWLAGDPRSIAAAVQTYAHVGSALKDTAGSYARAVDGLGAAQWSGPAADAYRQKAAEWVDALDGAARAAELESVLIAATGGLCAGVRAELFQLISAAIERWVLVGLVALANSAWTFGASIAGWVIDVEIEAGLLAARMAAKIADLIGRAGRVAETLGRDGSTLARIGDKLTALSERMMHNVRSARSTLGWDTRYSHLDRTNLTHMKQDADHLMGSLDQAGKLVHRSEIKIGVTETRDAVAAADDPSAEHLGKLAGDSTAAGTKIGLDQARSVVTHQP